MTGEEIYNELLESGSLMFYALRGSRLFGTFTEESDYDYHGVFMLPNTAWLSLYSPTQNKADPNEDVVFYGMRKYIGMAMTNNPTVIEMLWTPQDAIVHSTPVMNELIAHRDLFVTKKCFWSFSGYAFDQIKKAKGKNKKVHGKKDNFNSDGLSKLKDLLNNDSISAEWVEMRFCKHFLDFLLKGEEVRLTEKTDFKKMDEFLADENISFMLPPRRSDFLYVVQDGVTPVRPIPLKENLHIDLSHMACSSLEHIGHMYRLYLYGEGAPGVFSGGEVKCSSIPISDEHTRFFGFLIEGRSEYESAKKEWRSYWEWMAKRNESRWKSSDDETFEFDRKNMQHTFRLILSAQNIAREGFPTIRFKGDDLAFLREVREGKYDYDYLIELAQEKLDALKVEFEESSLPDSTNTKKVNDLYTYMCEMRGAV